MAELEENAVVFEGLKERYAISDRIQFLIRFDNGLISEVQIDDRICLFKVGWKHVSESLAHRYVAECSKVQCDQDAGPTRRVIFNDHELQIDPECGVVYQFCYVSDSSGVMATSQSFQITGSYYQQDHEEEAEQSDDSLVVLNENGETLEDQLREAMQVNKDLERRVKELEDENQSLKDKVTSLESDKLESSRPQTRAIQPEDHISRIYVKIQEYWRSVFKSEPTLLIALLAILILLLLTLLSLLVILLYLISCLLNPRILDVQVLNTQVLNVHEGASSNGPQQSLIVDLFDRLRWWK